MKKIIATTLTFLSLTSLAMPVNVIMKKAHQASYYQGNDGKAQMLMKVFPKNATTPIKKRFYMLRYDIEDGGRQMFLTYFERPSDIKRTTFLVHKFIDKDDFRRLYIPASDKIIPIAGSRKQDPFMGSDFSYEDVSGRHVSKDNHKLIKEELLNGKLCYVTESIPKTKESSIAKITAWIDKKSYIPLQVKYTNHDGKIYRIYNSESIKNIQGFPTIMKRIMSSPLEGTKTIMLINPKKVQYNIGLDKSMFSERSLKNPPMQYLK